MKPTILLLTALIFSSSIVSSRDTIHNVSIKWAKVWSIDAYHKMYLQQDKLVHTTINQNLINNLVHLPCGTLYATQSNKVAVYKEVILLDDIGNPKNSAVGKAAKFFTKDKRGRPVMLTSDKLQKEIKREEKYDRIIAESETKNLPFKTRIIENDVPLQFICYQGNNNIDITTKATYIRMESEGIKINSPEAPRGFSLKVLENSSCNSHNTKTLFTKRLKNVAQNLILHNMYTIEIRNVSDTFEFKNLKFTLKKRTVLM